MYNIEWRLWLDDQAYDQETPVRWSPPNFLVATSSKEAQALVEQFGPPIFMDLDHDLGIVDGETDDAMKFLHWLSDKYPGQRPQYMIHSQNVQGQLNIHAFMTSWAKVWKAPWEPMDFIEEPDPFPSED